MLAFRASLNGSHVECTPSRSAISCACHIEHCCYSNSVCTMGVFFVARHHTSYPELNMSCRIGSDGFSSVREPNRATRDRHFRSSKKEKETSYSKLTSNSTLQRLASTARIFLLLHIGGFISHCATLNIVQHFTSRKEKG